MVVIILFSTAEIWTELKENERFYLQLWLFLREKANKRDMLTQTNRTFLGCYLSVSRVLFTWMRLVCFRTLLFTSVPRITRFRSVLCGVSHADLKSTLLAPYYHISDKRGCMVITNEVFHFTWNHQCISPSDRSLSSFPHVETVCTRLQKNKLTSLMIANCVL